MNERESTTYLGFTLEIGEVDIRILDRNGRELAVEKTISRARCFCRGYRKADRVAA